MCQVNVFTILGNQEAIVKLVRTHIIIEPNLYAITTSNNY